MSVERILSDCCVCVLQLVTQEQRTAIMGVLGQVHISDDQAGDDLKAKEEVKVQTLKPHT